MAASLNDLHKSSRLDGDPSSPNGSKQFKHWLGVFTSFLEMCEATSAAQEALAPNRLQILFTYVSADVHEHVQDCETYDDAIQKLRNIFIIAPNVVFARYQLATRKQLPRETLEDFYQSLHMMSKHCGLRDVTAEEYWNELVRDAFINGTASHSIRQRLLENSQLTVTQAFDNARSLRTAQQHSAAYLNQTDIASILPEQDTVASIEDKSRDRGGHCTLLKYRQYRYFVKSTVVKSTGT